ncbi:MAG: hypothetical protein WC242_04290 [Candidatus Paceibacterota bacterium]|jgi:hypothetical protein
METWVMVVDDNGRSFYICHTDSWIKIMSAAHYQSLGISPTMPIWNMATAIGFLERKCEEKRGLLRIILSVLLSTFVCQVPGDENVNLVRVFELK